jgi:TldD protein
MLVTRFSSATGLAPVDVKPLKSALDGAKGVSYADLRLEVYTAEYTVAEDGTTKALSVVEGATLGARAWKGRGWGFASSDLSNVNEPRTLSRLAKEMVRRAVKGAKAGRMSPQTELADVKAADDHVTTEFRKEPAALADKERLAREMTKELKEKPNIRLALASLGHSASVKQMVSTDGHDLTMEGLHVFGDVFLNGAGPGGNQSYHEPYGAYAGWEFVEKTDPLAVGDAIAERVKRLVTDAKMPSGDTKPVVITPEFGRLLVHEICGHPCEADRALGGESAWAGRAWWSAMRGERVMSDQVTVISDARPQGNLAGAYGSFAYDDEGTPSSRVVCIENGILKNYLHSRYTASAMGVAPNGGMRANSASQLPYIRMTNTFFEPAKQGPSSLEEAIDGIKDGIVLGHASIPSIDSIRYNWQINMYEAHEIKNGRVGGMLKNPALLGNTPEFLGSIRLVGNAKTWKLYPIPNCGKGDPMQTIRVGNGGPIMVGEGRVVGVA